MALRRLLFLALAGALTWVPALSAQGQTGTITGRVVDAATMQPLAGANVAVEGTQRGTVTRADGGFMIPAVQPGTYQLRASVIGYAPQSRAVTVTAGAAATVEFSLAASAVVLQEVVAIGYGERRARDVTGSVEVVSAEQFNQGRIVSPEALIQGKVAGVQIATSGEPGGGTSIRIRGGSSLTASNEPLIVVDGVPLPHGGGLSAGRNPLNFLNPNDIENVTVLKDAASTAIYGSRGANGVILIRTRSGTAVGPQFSYSTSLSTSRALAGPDMLSADEFRQVVQQRAPNRVTNLGTGNTDWRDAVLRDGQGQEHSLAVNGAGDNMNYRLSLGYLDQEGIVRGSRTERVSGALNYNHRMFEDRLNVRASIRGSRTDDEFTPGGGIGTATIFDPTQPIRTSAGEFFEQRAFSLAPTNPVAELEQALAEGTTFRAVTNIEAQYRMPFLDALSATVRLGYDVAASERREFQPGFMWGRQRTNQGGYMNRSNPRETTGVLDAWLTYALPVGPMGSNFDATLGHSYETSRGDYPFFEVIGLATDALGPDGVPRATQYVPRLSVRENRLASFFGRANYNLMDRYQFSVSVRRDGSSRFSPDNQWGTFPAASVAWRLSSEPFMQNLGVLSDLRLRASWGINGNQAIGDYLWIPTYQFGDPFTQVQWGDQFVSTVRPNAFNPNIKWEETTSLNLALDYGFFNNRLTGALEVYRKDTDDLLFTVAVPAGANLSNRVLANVGSVRNDGVELSLNGLVYDGGPNGLRWSANFNAAHNRNEVLRLTGDDATERFDVGGIAGGVGNNIQILQPGLPANTFFVHSGDGNRRAFNSPAPDWTFGHSSQFGFRNADLSFTLRSHQGNWVYNNLASSQGWFNLLNQAGGLVNLHRSVLTTGFEGDNYFHEVYVEDASFIRMDNLTLGYTLPQFRAAQQVRLFGTVQNVFTSTNYSGVDPEVGIGGIDNAVYPRSRTFTVGASVGF